MFHDSVSMSAVVEASRRSIGGVRAGCRATEKDDARANRGGTKGTEELDEDEDAAAAAAAVSVSTAGVRRL